MQEFQNGMLSRVYFRISNLVLHYQFKFMHVSHFTTQAMEDIKLAK